MAASELRGTPRPSLDCDAYLRLVEPHRGELRRHCHRMLGSADEAEDALQETLLRAWKGLPGFEGHGSLRGWLYRIATHTSLDAIERRSKRPAPLPAEAIDEGAGGAGVGSAPPVDRSAAARYEERESIELAFLAAVQRLPRLQLGALILREVLGYSAREAAEVLGTTVASVHSALQRARNRFARARVSPESLEALRHVDDRDVRELVRRYADASERADAKAIIRLIAPR